MEGLPVRGSFSTGLSETFLDRTLTPQPPTTPPFRPRPVPPTRLRPPCLGDPVLLLRQTSDPGEEPSSLLIPKPRVGSPRREPSVMVPLVSPELSDVPDARTTGFPELWDRSPHCDHSGVPTSFLFPDGRYGHRGGAPAPPGNTTLPTVHGGHGSCRPPRPPRPESLWGPWRTKRLHEDPLTDQRHFAEDKTEI